MANALDRARLSLEGLSVADAFGERLLHAGHARAVAIDNRAAPMGSIWKWTDDTAMAISIVETLRDNGFIAEEALAQAFAQRYWKEPARGYGGGAHRVLSDICAGTSYDVAAREVFEGTGSMGNGGGMRSAPIGAFFCDDLAKTVDQARRSAKPTHMHEEGIAGAIAVAVAAARTFAGERDPAAVLAAVIEHTPKGATQRGLIRARDMLKEEAVTIATELGNGSNVTSPDTIPFAVWIAATHLDNYAEAMWLCGEVGGDIDTTCAIAGGIIVGACDLDGIPADWRTQREPLPII